MKIINAADLESLDKYYRINLINTLTGVKTPSMIGTKGKGGTTNLGIFNSIVHIGANPASVGFIMRPRTVERHTYDNIRATNQYTINIVPEPILKNAHHSSAKYPRDVSEFDKCELTEMYLENFHAPFVKESNIKLGLSYIEEHEIYNGTILMVGKIDHIIIDENFIESDGSLNHEMTQSVAVSGLYSYYNCSFSTKLDFARPL